MQILVDEFVAAVPRHRRGQRRNAPGLPPLPVQYADYAQRQAAAALARRAS